MLASVLATLSVVWQPRRTELPEIGDRYYGYYRPATDLPPTCY